MALLTFPATPSNGDIYPVSPPAGTNVYSWSSADNTWVLLGKATGVAAGTYGTPLDVPQITVDSVGRITFAQNVAIQIADTTQIGLVQLVDDTITNDPTKALTAAMGFYLQNQIGDPTQLNPFYPNLVTAINALGAPTGVTPGTYGNGTNVARFTVNAQGRLTFAGNVPLALATTTSPGVIRVGANLNVTGTGVLSVPNASTTQRGAVQLVDDTVTNDPTKALTAAAGYDLQLQIDDIRLRSNLTFAGTVNASTGLLTSVTPEAASIGFAVGALLPVPTVINDEYFVVATVSGTFTPSNSPTYSTQVGDWLISDGSQWVLYPLNLGSVTEVDTGAGLTGGPITTTGTISLLPATTSSLGGVIPDGLTISVSPAGNISVISATTTKLGGVIPDGTTILVSPTGVISGVPSQFTQLNDISGAFDGVAKSFPLAIGITPYAPGNVSNLLISLGGVLQIPGDSFTVSGSTITFVTAPEDDTTFVGYILTAGGSPGGGGGGGGSVTSVGTGVGLSGGPITTTGTISLTPATTAVLGGVIPDGTTITVSPSGVISAVGAATPSLQTVTNTGATTTNAITVAGLTSNGAVIPGANDTYDLGSATRRWRDLYVSSNSIYMGTSQLTVSGGVLLLNGSPVGGGGSVGTLQTVTDNGATTTNSVTFDRSASGSGSAIVVKPSAGGKGINVLGNGAIEFLSPSGGQYYSSIQPGFESLSIGVANGGFVINVSSLTTQITNQLQASGLRYPTSDGTAGQVLSTNGSGTLSWITAGGGSVGTLQTVTDNGATTTNTIRLFDSVTSFEAITLDPQSGLISILPQALGDPGLYLSPTGATIGNSTGSFRSAGLFPCAVNFNGSAGASLQTAGDGFPVQLWAGGTNLIGSPQVSVTGTATTISNQLIVRDANYQRFSVDNSTGLVRIGNGAAAAGGSPGLEIYTPGSTTPTVDIEGSTGSILTLGTITIDGTNNGNYPLIVKSGSDAQSLRIVGRTSDFRSIIDFTNPAQTVSLWNIQALPSTLTFGDAGSQYLAITSGTTSVNNNLQVAGTFKVQSLTYPTSDGTANQVLSTNGSGTLGWITTAKVVATPGSSAAGGNDNEISFDAAGNFYFFKGGSWWKVAGSSF